MRFREEINFVIAAPRTTVWAAFQDFESWPSWSNYIKEVRRQGTGWHFRARGQPVLDIIFVLEALRREEPRFVEFQSIPDYPHNLECGGWLELTELDPHRTQMRLVFEGGPQFESALINNLANWWVGTFDEPSKILKLTFEEFKEYLERQYRGVDTAQDDRAQVRA